MRKILYTAMAAAGLAAGCTSPHGWGAGLGQAKPGGQALSQSGGAPQPTWSQRLMAPFSQSSAVSQRATSAAAAERQQQLDPISLGYDSKPPSPSLFVAMAEMSQRGGNTDEARKLYQKALEMEPNNIDALLGRARLEDREGKLRDAQVYYQRAVKAQPRNGAALNDLALCLARQGHLSDSRQLLSQAVQIDPKKPLYRNNMAKVLIEMNRLDDAADQLATVFPQAATQYNMGVLLAERGRNAEAARALSAAIALDPQMAPARTLLAQIKAPRGSGQSQAVAQGTSVYPSAMSSDMPTSARPSAGTAVQQSPRLPRLSPPAQQVDNSILPTSAGAGEAVGTASYPSTGIAESGAEAVAEAMPSNEASGVGSKPSTLPPLR